MYDIFFIMYDQRWSWPLSWSLLVTTYDILLNIFLTQAFGDHLSARLTKLKVRRESEANVEEAGGSKWKIVSGAQRHNFNFFKPVVVIECHTDFKEQKIMISISCWPWSFSSSHDRFPYLKNWIHAKCHQIYMHIVIQPGSCFSQWNCWTTKNHWN